MNMNIFSEEILYPNLYKQIKTICDVEPNYSPLFIASNLFGLTSYICNNKFYIKFGAKSKINTGLMLLNVGSSGIGKTLSENLVLDPLRDLDEKNTALNEAYEEFAKACSGYLNTDSYKEAVDELVVKATETSNKDKNKIRAEAEEKVKDDFTNTYYYSHYGQENPNGFRRGDFEFSTKAKKFPIYIDSDFTPESVAVDFTMNPNKILLINTSEYHTLIENLTKTGSGNPYHFMINYLDGKKSAISRKTIGRINSHGFATITTSTTPKSFMNEILKSKLFSSGLGYRVFYCLDEVRPFELKDIPPDLGVNPIERLTMEFQSKINRMISIYMGQEENINFVINGETELNYFNEKMKNFAIDYKVLISERLDDDDENSAYSRLHFNLMKTILVLHLMNNAFELDDAVFHFANRDLPWQVIGLDSIERGFKLFHIFADSIIRSVTGEVYHSNYQLTKKERKLLEAIEIGETVTKQEFVKRIVTKEIASQSKAYEFFNNKKIVKYFNVDGFGSNQKYLRIS